MLSEEVAKLIGKGGDVRVAEVEKGGIKRFADAIGDPNPLYYDEEYARKSRYGSIIAPRGFFGQPKGSAPSAGVRAELRPALRNAGYTNPAPIDAGAEYEFFRPVRAGDIIVSVETLKEVVEREGSRGGKMAFSTIETTYVNQNGDLVAKHRSVSIQR